ncbi:hypothetical protein F441_19316 [Phytophthora nicotianae CJ01A1]|uniref:Uncharacterized protein n=1 Tax=Phytophthora nicotianae CJ01A1 TaxID=1317063 RepID=W2VZR5_PHYNI|nr:hypothetical protein F441_19316 [Phytophthora nicotianae CJ01A1]
MVAAVRMTRTTKLGRATAKPIEGAMTAKDGEKGIFLPTNWLGSVMLVATVTEARGKAWIPAINASGGHVKLPSKRELGTWVPLDKDVSVLEVSVLEVSGAMRSDAVRSWLDELGYTETPLEKEDDVHIGVEGKSDRSLVTKQVQGVWEPRDTRDCPPAISLNIKHHIDTGNAAPIMLKRRRQA